MSEFEIIWTTQSEFDIDDVYQFYFKISQELAIKIISEIILETENLVFAEQFQVDDINPNYRRIIANNYKVLYKIIENKIVIYGVFDCRMNPERLKGLK